MRPLLRRERLFFVVTGLVEGMLTALTLASGKMLREEHALSLGLALRIGLAAGFPTAVVFIAAEYARQRGELVRMAYQLNMTRRERLVAGNLGRQALHESLRSAAVAGLCSFGGAALPLAAAGEIPGGGWAAVVVAVLCLGGLGAAIGYTTLSCRLCWALALTAAGGLLAWLGAVLQVL